MALVKMRHDDPIATAGPTTADVPEEAVERWKEQGWYLDDAASQPQPAPAPEREPEPQPNSGHQPQPKGRGRRGKAGKQETAKAPASQA